MIHQFKFNGFNIVVDANSASVHSVDDAAYDVISRCDELIMSHPGNSLKKRALEILGDPAFRNDLAAELSAVYEIPQSDLSEVMDDLIELCSEGLIWSDDPYEEAAGDLKLKQSVLKAICLHVAHGCNMDCEYCFAGKGDYSGKSGIMSLETGKKALDYLVANSGNRKHLEVDFFGGEPLLNWDVCKKLVEYGRELEKTHNKIFNFTLTTNGVLIDEDVIDFTDREMGNVVLSMDGRRETHDRMRHTKSGDGTYDRIMDNFKALVRSRTDDTKDHRSSEYYMRGTYTAYNKDFSRDVIAMADLGFRETSIEPVVSSPDVPYALHEEDLPQLFDEYEKLALEMYDRRKRGEGFNFYHYTVNLTGGPCIYKRVAGCGVATEYLAVTPTGDLYPCHQFVGDDDMIVGNIYEGITHPETVKIFSAGNNLYTRDECRGCWAKLYCAGGCAANNYHSNGDINKVYKFGCELQRKRIECALMLAVSGSEERSE
ncbi:MAG: thioether cross-link-forming SCIFF peptide maturase [Mogibacterium sp.]|nr:thioether cross-link-forming SCIFF peptide maturase [Mogibacterium sp.]